LRPAKFGTKKKDLEKFERRGKVVASARARARGQKPKSHYAVL